MMEQGMVVSERKAEGIAEGQRLESQRVWKASHAMDARIGDARSVVLFYFLNRRDASVDARSQMLKCPDPSKISHRPTIQSHMDLGEVGLGGSFAGDVEKWKGSGSCSAAIAGRQEMILEDVLRWIQCLKRQKHSNHRSHGRIRTWAMGKWATEAV